MKPLSNFVIVAKTESEKQVGSIIITSAAAKDKLIGTVLEVGPGNVNIMGTLIPTTVKVGEEVVFTLNNATPITIKGKEYLIMPETDILAVL